MFENIWGALSIWVSFVKRSIEIATLNQKPWANLSKYKRKRKVKPMI